MRRFFLAPLAAVAIVAMGGSAMAQVRTVDPNQAIDSDLTPHAAQTDTMTAAPPAAAPAPQTQQPYQTPTEPMDSTAPAAPATQQPYLAPPQASTAAPANEASPADGSLRTVTSQSAATYNRDDLMSAAEGVFGKGAEGLAGIIEKVLKDQGQPNAYIAGREASGAFIVGLRYGSGILYSKIEGQMPVYWTGPSVGFDVGGDANKVFVLVYNLYDSEELFKRFPAGEGHLYFVGGFSASYLRSGNVVLIPVRLGVGWRAGVNVGYMKFSHHEKWLPF